MKSSGSGERRRILWIGVEYFLMFLGFLRGAVCELWE